MKELPVPTWDLSPATHAPAWWRKPLKKAKQNWGRPALAEKTPALPPVIVPIPHSAPVEQPKVAPAPALKVQWAKHLDEVRAAQRLRHDVFVGEMGATIPTTLRGHDIDLFDDFCEHLLVRDGATGEAVGTYRVLTPAQARRVGGLYTATEFDLVRLRHLRPQMVELGRSCVHPDYRSGAVMMALWGALAEFMGRNQLDVMVGCASIPMAHKGLPLGHAAASIWQQVRQTHLADIAYQVTPRCALPIDDLQSDAVVEPPALVKGYLRLGARVLGAPAWDPDFQTADLPMMMRVQDLPGRFRRIFDDATKCA